MKKQKLIISGFILCLLICLIFFFYVNNGRSGVLNWKKGDKLSYEIEFDCRTLIEANAVIDNTPLTESDVKYKVNLLFKVIEVDDTCIFLKGMTEKFTLINKNNLSSEIDFYNLPFLCELNKYGNINKLYFSILLPKDKITLIESIVYNFQFTFYPAKEKWTAIENLNNSSGSSEVIYSFNKKENAINKTILNYKSPNIENDVFRGAIPKINKGTGYIVLSKDKSWVRSIINELNIDFLKDKKKVFQSEAKFVARAAEIINTSFWEGSDNVNQIIAALQDPFRKGTLSDKEKKAEDIIEKENLTNPKSIEDAIIKIENQGLKVEPLLNLYISKYFQNQNSVEAKEMLNIIVGYLKKHPEECQKIVDLIKSNTLPFQGSGFLFLILEKTGHKKAQEALISILEQPYGFPGHAQIRATGALIGISSITEDVFSRLVSIERAGAIPDKGARGTVLLAIGAFGRGAINPNIKEEAVNYVQEKLLGINNANDISSAAILDAAGNTADPKLLPVIERFIFESKNEVVKDAAIQSLTHIPEKEANPVIVKILKSEDIKNIGSAVKVLNKRENFYHSSQIDPEINTVLKDYFPKTKESVEIRKSIAEYLTINKDNHKMLLEIADNKTENWEVRKIIYSKIPIGEEQIKPERIKKSEIPIHIKK